MELTMIYKDCETIKRNLDEMKAKLISKYGSNYVNSSKDDKGGIYGKASE